MRRGVILDDIGPSARPIEKLLLVCADRLDGEVLDPGDKAVPVVKDELCYDIEVDPVVFPVEFVAASGSTSPAPSRWSGSRMGSG